MRLNPHGGSWAEEKQAPLGQWLVAGDLQHAALGLSIISHGSGSGDQATWTVTGFLPCCPWVSHGTSLHRSQSFP